jgi:hypothetical protein
MTKTGVHVAGVPIPVKYPTGTRARKWLLRISRPLVVPQPFGAQQAG